MNRHGDPETWHEDHQGDSVQLVQPARGSGLKNRIEIEFEAGPTAAAGARNALHELEGRVSDGLLRDVRLLVSELVTNSVRHSNAHARDVVHVLVSVTENSLRVEVADPGSGFEPKPRDDDRTRPGGWGLYLVDQLADRWGVARDELTRVWFEMDQRRDGIAA
jgi:anti-sigma regulatory factor (Ser/Thr protein kinase)